MESTLKKPGLGNVKLGRLLEDSGALNRTQVEAILRRQETRSTPFGALAERMFGVDPRQVERAWAEQYSRCHAIISLESQRFDLDQVDRLNRRQAWQLRILPMRIEDGFLIVLTTRQALPGAVNFCRNTFDEPVVFRIASEELMSQALDEYHTWPAMTLAWQLRRKLLAKAEREPAHSLFM